jgi:hypothetical protein
VVQCHLPVEIITAEYITNGRTVSTNVGACSSLVALSTNWQNRCSAIEELVNAPGSATSRRRLRLELGKSQCGRK